MIESARFRRPVAFFSSTGAQNMTHKLRPGRVCLVLTIFSLAAAVECHAATLAQQAGAAQAAQSKFRLLRSISGSKGHEQGGRYVLDDPRTVFKVPDD